MKPLLSFALASTALFASSALGMSAWDDTQDSISWKGCGITKTAFLKACASAYTEETGVVVKISGGGATKGILAAADGSADFGGTCRGCLPALKENELGLSLALVAWDALVPIVHPTNPVQDISKADLIGVFTGKISDWSQLGGPAGPISVLVRDGKTSGVGFAFRQIVIGDEDFEFSENAIRYESSGPLEQQVESNARAIAITGISSAHLRKVKVLSVDGNQPTQENIASAKYPYYRPLFMTFKRDLPAKKRAFLDYILGERGQAIIAAQGVVNLAAGWKLVQTYQHFLDTSMIENHGQLLRYAEERTAELSVR